MISSIASSSNHHGRCVSSRTNHHHNGNVSSTSTSQNNNNNSSSSSSSNSSPDLILMVLATAFAASFTALIAALVSLKVLLLFCCVILTGGCLLIRWISTTEGLVSVTPKWLHEFLTSDSWCVLDVLQRIVRTGTVGFYLSRLWILLIYGPFTDDELLALLEGCHPRVINFLTTRGVIKLFPQRLQSLYGACHSGKRVAVEDVVSVRTHAPDDNDALSYSSSESDDDDSNSTSPIEQLDPSIREEGDEESTHHQHQQQQHLLINKFPNLSITHHQVEHQQHHNNNRSNCPSVQLPHHPIRSHYCCIDNDDLGDLQSIRLDIPFNETRGQQPEEQPYHHPPLDTNHQCQASSSNTSKGDQTLRLLSAATITSSAATTTGFEQSAISHQSSGLLRRRRKKNTRNSLQQQQNGESILIDHRVQRTKRFEGVHQTTTHHPPPSSHLQDSDRPPHSPQRRLRCALHYLSSPATPHQFREQNQPLHSDERSSLANHQHDPGSNNMKEQQLMRNGDNNGMATITQLSDQFSSTLASRVDTIEWKRCQQWEEKTGQNVLLPLLMKVTVVRLLRGNRYVESIVNCLKHKLFQCSLILTVLSLLRQNATIRSATKRLPSAAVIISGALSLYFWMLLYVYKPKPSSASSSSSSLRATTSTTKQAHIPQPKSSQSNKQQTPSSRLSPFPQSSFSTSVTHQRHQHRSPPQLPPFRHRHLEPMTPNTRRSLEDIISPRVGPHMDSMKGELSDFWKRHFMPWKSPRHYSQH